MLNGLLAGHTVLVTGSAGDGVGAGVCEAVRAAGGRLVLNGLQRSSLDTALDRYPGSVGYVADISDEQAVQRLFAAAAADLGPITDVVNNAGVGLSRPFFDATPHDFEQLMSVDLGGVWVVSRIFARELINAGRCGAIVNVSSVHAHATMDRYAVYAAAKAGVEGLTRGMAVELGEYGIRCNAIAPGYVHAEQNLRLLRTLTDDPAGWAERHTSVEQPLPRLIEPIDCGQAAVFLLSEMSRCITGQTVRVDAGLTARLYNRSTHEKASAHV